MALVSMCRLPGPVLACNSCNKCEILSRQVRMYRNKE